VINRENRKAVRAFLAYRREVDQLSGGSARLEESWLRHVLEWAQERPFGDAPKIRPAFPVYALAARLDSTGKALSPVYVLKLIGTARRFFHWLSVHGKGYKALSATYLDTLKAPRMVQEPTEHEAVTLEEVRAIAAAPARTVGDRRIRAAAVFWFLSGIRIGAFVTLPIVAVDLAQLTVKQWPGLGVKTKFGKHQTTYMLNLPDLLSVVRAWDQEVRAVMPRGLWFAPLSPDTGEIDQRIRGAGEHRHSRARRDLRDWLARVGLPYHSPHKFRHGNAVYSLKLAETVADLKAVSQNLMHSNLSITDGVYGILSADDTRERIDRLTRKRS
jgi:site-specific recombinase XerC